MQLLGLSTALLSVSLVAIKLLFHYLFKFSNSFFVANLIAISMWSVPSVMGVCIVCTLSVTISKRTSASKALTSGTLRQVFYIT